MAYIQVNVTKNEIKAAFPVYVQVMFCGMWMVRVFNVVTQPSRQLYKSKM